MIEYGTMINNQLIKHESYHDGDKPLTYEEAPHQDGYRAVFKWTERENDILQDWWLIEDDNPPEPMPPTETDYAEAYHILIGD